MAGKDTIIPVPIVTNGDMSGAITSKSVKIQGFDNIGFQLVYTGAPTGTFNFSISQDQISWVVLPDALFSPVGPIQAVGAPDDIFVELNQMTPAWVRMTYTFSSGTGTLNAQLTAKLI